MINIKTSITNKSENIKRENEIKAIKQKDKLLFKEDNTNVVIIYKDNSIILTRKNHEMEMSLDFIESKGYYKIENGILDLKINIKNIIIKENYIYIEYDIYVEDYNNGEFIFELKIN